MRVTPFLAVIAFATMPALNAQATTYTCRDGRVVATASGCATHNGKAIGKKHKKHHRKTTTTVSNGTVVTPGVLEKPAKPSAAKKVAHGAGEAGGEVSRLGKKASHGIGEAASDVKKAVTKKP
jgi:hypothetical protein